MYRLSQFFISDIIAGGNILQHGHAPIIHGRGRADHGVIFAANGTCKTTLLSFLLGVFCPERRRFIQHLQSGGDKTMEQYLIAGRPAIVVVDLIRADTSPLFEDTGDDRIVVGQLFYRHKRAPERVSRTFFMAQTPDLFETIRANWARLLEDSQPYQAVREFLLPMIQQTGNQREWGDLLERVGLDPWLVNRQIDFARTEGGIKDAFKFRAEADFLSFFLGCVTDLDAAAVLRENTAQSLDKMRDRPQKVSQLKTIEKLKQHLSGFEEQALNWRKACQTAADCRMQMGEAAHLLAQARQQVGRQLKQFNRDIRTIENQRHEAHVRMQTAEADRIQVEAMAVANEIADHQAQIAVATEAVDAKQAQTHAIKAAAWLAQIQHCEENLAIRQDAMIQADSQMQPLRDQLKLRAAQYHLRLAHEQSRIQAEGVELEEARDQADADLTQAKIELDARHRQSREVAGKIAGLASRIESAHEEMTSLHLLEDESPDMALDRLAREIAQIAENMHADQTRLDQIDQQLDQGQRDWKQIQHQLSETGQQYSHAREQQTWEATERQHLLADVQLQNVAGTSDFEPAQAQLASRLDEALGRREQSLENRRMQRAGLTERLQRLERMETLTADSQTRMLIEHLRDNGVAADQIRAFPEYLADQYDDPREIAAFIERDPGRFTGIMAADETILAKIKQIEAPEQLHKPVIVSMPCGIDAVTAVQAHVIAPRDAGVYSPEYLTGLKADVRGRIDQADADIQALQDQLVRWRETKLRLHAYRQIYPDAVAVQAMHHGVDAHKRKLDQLGRQSSELEAQTAQLQADKQTHQRQWRDQAAASATRQEWRTQIQQWLTRHHDLAQWDRARQQAEAERRELETRIEKIDADIKLLNEQLRVVFGRIERNHAQGRALAQRGADVPPADSGQLDASRRKQALATDLMSLRELYDAALQSQQKIASELGLDVLDQERQQFTRQLSQASAALDTYRRKHAYDSDLAEEWAAQNDPARDEHEQVLLEQIRQHRDECVRWQTQIEYLQQRRQSLQTELSQKISNGIHPAMGEAQIEIADLEALRVRFAREAKTQSEAAEKLDLAFDQQQKQAVQLEERQRQIELAQAETATYPAVWDQQSPRTDWPELGTDGEQARAIESFRNIVQLLVRTAREADRQAGIGRRKMDHVFDRMRHELHTDAFKQDLPAIVDELLRHDAESLSDQGVDFIAKCDDIAGNIAGDLSSSKQFVDNLVDLLFRHAKDGYQKLVAASREKVPDNVFIYGGNAILRAGVRLDFNRYDGIFRQSIENWLDELIDQNRLPEVNARAGNCMASELLYRLLRAASARKVFGIRLLKCDDAGSNYEPVGRDMGSGGEALTTAVLLYALLTSMRRKRRNLAHAPIPAFLVLDNPLGVCNRTDFLDAQLKVAQSMGIQCIYLTGINDRESLGLFDHRVIIRKGARKLSVDGHVYRELEVIQQSVNRMK